MWSPAKKHHWPKPAPRGLAGYKIAALTTVFQSVGYVPCKDDEGDSLEDGVDKIEHDTPADLEGPAYGQVAKYVKRKRVADAEPQS